MSEELYYIEIYCTFSLKVLPSAICKFLICWEGIFIGLSWKYLFPKTYLGKAQNHFQRLPIMLKFRVKTFKKFKINRK